MEDSNNQDRVFESAAQLFALLSTPMRLKIISAVCEKEKNVSELLALIDTTQPNMSQHLSTLHRRGVLSVDGKGHKSTTDCRVKESQLCAGPSAHK